MAGAAPAKPIRILIADDHPVVREGLAALIRSDSDLALVGEAANGKQAVQRFFLHHPDVLLLDLRMPEMNGIEVIRAILAKEPRARTIVLSTYGGDEDVYRALQAGAKAYLLKDAPRQELLGAIRAVEQGKPWMPRDASALSAKLETARFTEREMEIVRLMATGKTNKEIGAQLEITASTVKIHVSHILRKLGARGRAEAIRLVLESGIVERPPQQETRT
jgi:two-component system NarL family response regulator